MKCKYCGKDLIDGAKYCVYCAKPVGDKDKEDPETKEKIKEDNQAKLGVVIVLVIIILLALGGFFVYKKIIAKKPTKEENKVVEQPIEKKEEKPTITKGEVKELVDTYYFSKRSHGENLFTITIDENVKKTIALRNISNDAKTVECSQIGGFIMSDSVCVNNNKHITTNGKTIDYDTLNNKYKYLFGKESIDIPKENLKDVNEITTWEYDATKNEFLETFVITGFEHADSHIVYDVKDFSKEEDKLIVKVGYISLEPKEENNKVTYSAKVGEEEVTYTIEEVEKDSFDKEFIGKYLDKLDTYEITFKYEDDHYVFENIKKA